MNNNNPIKYSDLISPDDSIKNLITELEQLDAAYSKTLSSIKSQADELTDSLKNVSGATSEGRKKTKKAADDADRLARAQRDVAFAESENAKKLAELKLAQQEANQINKLVVKINQSAEGSYNKLSAQYSLNKIYLNNMTKAERENTEEGRKLVAQTREMYEEMKRLQEVTGKNQLNVGNYPQIGEAIGGVEEKLKSAIGLNNELGNSLLALGRGGEESKEVFSAMGDGAKALGKSLLGLMANPVFLAIAGVAAAGATFKWWYDYNAGLIEATRLTQQFTGKEGDDLKAFRNEVQAVADTFKADFKETLIATNALAKQFGISSDKALQLVKDGFISGGDANGEFLDTLKEYPAYFKEAGISAEQFVAIVTQTNKAGIFSDKGVDAIKEGNLRLREMTTATAAALDAIGISSVQVQKDLQTGAKTTFQVMQDVSAKLNELPDSATQVGTAIADIFGGPGEDAGLQYLRTLKDISTNMDAVKEKAGKLAQLQEQQLQSEIELQNTISALFDTTGGNFEEMTTAAKVFFNNGLAKLIRGTISLLNYFIELYNNSVTIRGIWNTTIAVLKTDLDAVGNLFNYFMDILKAIGNTIKGIFTLDWDAFNKGLEGFASALPKMIEQNIKDGADNMAEAFDNVGKKIKPIEIPVVYKDSSEKGSGRITTNAPNVIAGKTDKAGGKSNGTKEREREIEEVKQTEEEKLQLVKDSILLRLEAVKAGSEQERKLKRELLDTERKLELMRGKQSADDVNAKYDKKMRDLDDVYLKNKLALFDKEQEFAESEFDLVKHTEEEKTKFRLRAERDRLKKVLEINKEANNELSETEVETIKNRIKKLDNEINNTGSGPGKGRPDFYDLLGLNLSDEKKEAINTSISYAKEALTTLLDAKLQAANAAVAAADKEVNSSQKVLDAELQARANGYANNVVMAQKELELARKNQKKALKEQQKAQKAQQAVQSLQQISNLVTASALIWSQLGFPLAIPAIGVMWASFAASKLVAANLVKTEKYGDGTVELLSGGSHQSGNDIDFGIKPDGTRRRAEGGEYFAVINKRNSRRYRAIIPDVINSLNNGTFAAKYMTAYDGAQGMTLNVNANSDLRELSADVREIKEQNQQRIFTANGKTFVYYKNLKRTIK